MPATRARQRRGSGAPRGGPSRPASRPGLLRALSGDDLVGGFRVSDRSDDWFRDPAPRSSGRGGSGYPGASGPAEGVFGGGNPGPVWGSSSQPAGASRYGHPRAWPAQPPAPPAGRPRACSAAGTGAPYGSPAASRPARPVTATPAPGPSSPRPARGAAPAGPRSTRASARRDQAAAPTAGDRPAGGGGGCAHAG